MSQKLHVVLENERSTPSRPRGSRPIPATIALAQSVAQTQAQQRELRRLRTSLAQMSTYIARALPGVGSVPGPGPGPALSRGPRDVLSVARNARELVDAADELERVQEAVQRKTELGRMLDVNERRQQDVVLAIRNAQVRFGQVAQVMRARLAAAQANSDVVAGVMQGYNTSLASAQQQVSTLRQNLQLLRQERVDLDSQFDTSRQQEAILEETRRKAETAAMRLAPPPVPLRRQQRKRRQQVPPRGPQGAPRPLPRPQKTR